MIFDNICRNTGIYNFLSVISVTLRVIDVKKCFFVFLMLGVSIQISFSQSFESVNIEPEKMLVAMPSFSEPIVQLKKVSGELIKNVRVPEDKITTFPTYDGKYLIVIGAKAIHRVAIDKEEIISVPLEVYSYNADGVYTGANYLPLGMLTRQSDKAYLQESGALVKDSVHIYEVDFKEKSISRSMGIPIYSPKYAIDGSFYNRYILACSEPGRIDIYDLNDKSLLQTLKFDIPESWGDRAVDGYISYLMGSELNYQVRNYGNSEPALAFKVSYNLATNQILHQEFRTGEDVNVVYVFQPQTQAIFWTKSINEGAITQWEKRIFDDVNLTNLVFEFTGATMWQFDKADHNLINVTYHTGKIETYNITTKELVATKNNGGGLNDF